MLFPFSQKTINVINHFVTKMEMYILKLEVSWQYYITAIELEYMNLSSISFMPYHYLTYSFIALTVLDLFRTSESWPLRNGAILCTKCFFKKTLSNFQKCEACTYIIRSCFDNSLQDPFPFSHLLFYTLSVLVDPANQKLIIPSGKISHQNSCFPWCDWQTSCHSACHNKANKGYGWITHFHCSGLMPLKYLILFTEIKMILLR